MWWSAFVAIAFSFIAYRIVKRKSITKGGRSIKSAPQRLFALGHARQFLRPRHELFDWFVRCQRQYGLETLEIAVPTLPPGVIISDPKNLEYVLKNEQLVSKGDFVKSRTWDLFGHGILNSSGDLWRAQRKAGLKFFSGTNLEAMVVEVLPEAYSLVRSKLVKHTQTGTVVDLQALLLDFTSIVVGQMAYNMDLDSSHPFTKAFDYASNQIGLRFQNPLWPVIEFFGGSKLHVALAEVKKFGRQIVQQAKRDRSIAAFESLIDNKEATFDTLIDSLMETFRDPQIVADSALNFLSAGKDTTSQSLTWTLYCIMRHPEVLEPIHKEIASLRTEHPPGHADLKLSIADLQPSSVPFLMATFYESLRLYPPIPFEIQEAQQDLTLPDGTFLPKDAVVVWCIWAINRAKELYGEDAATFRPARWLDSEGKFASKSAFAYPVWNGGPRACLGRKMSEVMAMFVLANLLNEFSFTPAWPDVGAPQDRIPQNSLTLPMESGLPSHVHSTSPQTWQRT